MIKTTCLFPALVLTLAPPAYGEIVFNRDVRPVLSENCMACHGADPASRKAGLRLDTEGGFFEATDKRGPTVIPGKPDESPLYQRITSSDPDEVMPPPDSHKALKPEQKEILRQWIQQGAVWQPHWAFLKPARPELPQLTSAEFALRNPIDTLVLAKLQERGLTPAPEADRATLARRLALDLTGLLPEPDEVAAFVSDPSPDFYSHYVERLLSSPRYGENRARAWLDAARYADTHGLHFDNYREMWPYRDWVVRAFNANLPFDQFVTEQLAGDLLPNPTLDQRIATGFQRCNITTNEGGTIVEENLANYARDRVETTSWVFLGLTANCAVCHDHKFDPITTKDFYSMAAFFRNTTQGGLDGNNKEGASANIVVPQPGTDMARWQALPAEITAAEQKLTARRTEAADDFKSWITAVKAPDLGAGVSDEGLVAYAPLTEGAGDEIAAVCSQPMKIKAPGKLLWQPDGKTGPAPVISAASTFDLGNQGNFERNETFSYGAWVKAPGGNAFSTIMARMDEDRIYQGWDLFQHGGEFAVHIVNKWPDNALKVVSTGNALKPGEWQHVFVTYDGSSKAGGIRIFVNGEQAKLTVQEDRLSDSIKTAVNLRIGQRSKGQVFEGGSIQEVRVYSRRLTAEEVQSLYRTGPLRAMLAVDPDKRTSEQREALFDYYLTAVDAPWQAIKTATAALNEELAAIRKRSPITHVQEEKMDSKPMAAILKRGNYDQPGEIVEANVFHMLHPLPEAAPKSRLGLAQWLNAPENPLTARVTVNRLWQEIFGTGLVKTAEDFGLMGEAPVNQPLLDWLAVEFRESGWNVKHILTLMVSSSTYRQQAVATAQKNAMDPANRLLSRGPRFRMEAEVLRDSVLSASGLLSSKMGGPGVKPYQPDGVWDKVGMVEGNTRIYQQGKGEDLYRRSIYNFWKRMAPPASLEIFNAPARETSCLRRERTNTPLQALVTLNDVQYVEASRVLASNALKTTGADTGKTIEFIARRLLSRPLRPEENEIVTSTLHDLLAAYRAEPEAAVQLIAAGESKADPAMDPPTLAAWTLIANQLMNLDETLNK